MGRGRRPYSSAGLPTFSQVEESKKHARRTPVHNLGALFQTNRLCCRAVSLLAYQMRFSGLPLLPSSWLKQPYFPDDHRYDVRRPDHRPYKR
jgi:hypothetical protein